MGGGTRSYFTARVIHILLVNLLSPLIPSTSDRICPGRHFAEASLFIMVASILHTLSIDNVLDDHGLPIIPEAKMTYGVLQ